MKDETIKIKGMSCHHCVMAVRKAVSGIDGVKEADVEVGVARVKYDESKVRAEDIEKIITKIGYQIDK